jgi:hypothetical protein
VAPSPILRAELGDREARLDLGGVPLVRLDRYRLANAGDDDEGEDDSSLLGTLAIGAVGVAAVAVVGAIALGKAMDDFGEAMGEQFAEDFSDSMGGEEPQEPACEGTIHVGDDCVGG